MSQPGNIVRALVVAFVWLAWAAWVACCADATAQVRSLSSLERYETGQEGTLRIEWDGTTSATGMQVRLPAGWRVLDAGVYSPARGLEEATVRRRGASHHVFVTSPRLKSACTVLVRFVAAYAPGRSVARVAPLQRVSGQSVVVDRDAVDQPASTIRVVGRGASRNNVGDFSGTAYLELRRGEGVAQAARNGQRMQVGQAGRAGQAGQPGVRRPGDAYTVALWLRTTRSDEVVLSDWSGDEEDAYGMELVVVADGTLAFYRGRDGVHQSMRADTPVADGKWHHVAVSFDGDAGWSRLFVDGVVADSLLDHAWVGTVGVVGLGDRAMAASGDVNVIAGASDVAFTGFVDDVMLWSAALDARDVHRMVYGETPGEPDIRVDFEDASHAQIVPVARVHRDARDPMLSIRAEVRGSLVALSWEARNEQVTEYEVQQSSDGQNFRQVGIVQPDDGLEGMYTFSDAGVDGSVAYYRVAQRISSGLTRLSPVVKVGVADVMEAAGDAPVELALNNFPNPFRETTSIHYELPEDGPVQVSVWDLSGSPVATLVDETQAAGAHEVAFTGGDLPAGTYFVRVEQGRYLRSHKLLLLK